MKPIIRLCSVILILIAGCLGICGKSTIVSRSFSARNGLPSNKVSTIVPDANGLVWISTWNGLAFYDSYRFVTFRDSKETGHISSNRIHGMCPDSLCNVWFVTSDRRLNMLDNSISKFIDVGAMSERPEDIRSFRVDDFYSNGRRIWGSGLEQSSSKAVTITVPEKRGGKYKISVRDLGEIVPGAKRLKKVVFGADGRDWILTDAGAGTSDGRYHIRGVFADICTLGRKVYLVSCDGRIFFGTESMKEHVKADIGNASTIIPVDAHSIAIAGSKGLAVIDIRRPKSTVYSVGKEIVNIYADSFGRVWSFTGDGDITMLKSSGEFVNLGPAPATGSIIAQPLFHEDRKGTVWLAPEGKRLSYYDENERRLVPVCIDNIEGETNTGLSYDKFFADHKGNLWLTSTIGLTLLNFNDAHGRNIAFAPDHETRSVIALKDNGIVAGSVDGMVARYDSNGLLVGYLTKKPDASSGKVALSKNPIRFSDHVYALHADHKDNLWIGSKTEGLYVVDKEGNFRNYSARYNDDRHLDCDSIYAFANDSRERLWIATFGKGIFLATSDHRGNLQFTSITKSSPHYPKGIGYQYVRRIIHHKGLMVLSTNAGIVTFRDDFGSVSEIKFNTSGHQDSDNGAGHDKNVMQTLISRDGKHAFANMLGGSVKSIDVSTIGTDHLKLSDMPQQELSYRYGNILSMAEGPDGEIYMVRETDIACYDPTSGKITVLGNDILGGEQEFSEALPATAPDGRLYFGAFGQIVRVNPAEIKDNLDKPEIVFTSLRLADGKERNILNPTVVELEPDNRNFSISFAALDYTKGARLEYAYRLDSDTAWTYLGKLNQLQINDLKAGKHRLYVKSTNRDGTWVDNEKYVDIMARRRFGESIWAWLLYICLGSAAIGFAIYFSRLRRRQRDAASLLLFESPEHEVPRHEELPETVPSDPTDNPVRIEYKLESPQIMEEDSRMMEQLMKFLEERIGDENLRIEDLADAVGMSRTVFYVKIKSIVGMPPSDFLRKLRLQRAEELIKKSKMTFSQIAFAVGFSDPKYFTKCFKKETGMTPSEYRRK